MPLVPPSSLRLTLLAASLLAGIRPVHPGAPAPDRVVLLSAGDPDYLALAIPASYKTAPGAPTHLLVFHGGLCVRDLGLVDEQSKDGHATDGTAVVEQAGTIERA